MISPLPKAPERYSVLDQNQLRRILTLILKDIDNRIYKLEHP